MLKQSTHQKKNARFRAKQNPRALTGRNGISVLHDRLASLEEKNTGVDLLTEVVRGKILILPVGQVFGQTGGKG
jgi:hypothetical protein